MHHKQGALCTLGAALGVCLGFVACATYPSPPSKQPVALSDSEGAAEASEAAKAEAIEAGSPEDDAADSLDAEAAQAERAPPWSPPRETILSGVEGAGQLLALGRARDALDHLAGLDALGGAGDLAGAPAGDSGADADSQSGQGRPERTPESREWFLAGAIAGRAHMRLDQPDQAVLALEPLAASKQFADQLPRDIVGYELAVARVAWAKSGALDRAAADIQLRKAVDELGALKSLSPDRMRAAMRAAQGEAMAAIQGEDERASKRAAKKADKALERLISSFPNHPEVGVWMLERALAKLRAGATEEGAAALRRVYIERAGEPEAEQAWEALTALAADQERPKFDAGPLSAREAIDAGGAARVLRRLERSAALLEPLWTDEDQPRHVRREAGRSLAWTYYKTRDYDACAEIFAALYREVPSHDTRGDLSRCLERGGRYEEAVDLWAGDEPKDARAASLWTAIELAVDGGLYQRASDLLEVFEKHHRYHASERRWLHAWLPLRLGLDEQARVAFTELVEQGRAGERERAARYFLGKLELASEDRARHLQGVQRLQDLAGEGDQRVAASGVIGGTPIYYGLMARARLREAGEDPGPEPVLGPLDWESRWIDHAQTLDLLKTAATRYGEYFSSLVRAEQLYAAGWREEGSRELRVALDEYINARSVYEGGDMPGTRTEALVAGLAWAPQWRHPKAVVGRAGRQAMRDEQLREDMRELFMELAWAGQEPYRFAKLSAATYPYRTRWHLRAYREPIERHAWTREVDPHHLWALMYTESRFRRHVVSYVGARGALQIMPWTGRQLAERLGELEPGERFDPDLLFRIEDNSRLATYYISELLAKFHGQPTFAYASYNGGPSNVARWLKAKAQGPRGVGLDEFVEEIPFSETAKYARRVMEVQAVYDLMYRGSFPQWSNEVDPEFEQNIDF
ncbi:lytic transglycosylase domain-containing protein [Pseudenhygromyxa sp. WMMC2535]|uniref:lytic transglycosylase domain-containing protein n=1 Tax=Pseudenhygromyxa sp. WMMC2535 TaxID=2712867 RepID=UPI00159618BB|nr:lytic transglycosylase domain-containing protein [Pseudenhygromyxa sp. WMMC2535]NVB39513.1 lytic transglycosylase domain-containing protein [Pseudenhygromyxa sp. WMMC2535]